MPPFPRLPRATPLWTLALLALLFWGSFNLLQYRAWFGATRDNEARPGGSFQERLPPAPPFPSVYLDSDSFYWLHLATGLLEEGSWRPRHTDWDNVPLGRPNHWSSPLVWLMAGTARLAAFFSDRPATEWLDITSPWINPTLFGLLLGALAWLLGRRTDPWTAGLLVLALATLPPVLRSFSVLHIDHHGVVLLPALGMTLCLLLGVTDPAAPPRRGWFIASGILGGIGLWLQASHQLILIAGTLGGLLLWGFFAPPPARSGPHSPDPGLLLHPSLWRAWAVAGAGISLAAYLLEYAPAHLGMHLEVNHPLYALCWWGGTESILAIALSRRERSWPPSRWTLIALGALPVAATLCLLLLGPERWFQVSSPFLLRIHGQIKEFQPLLATPRGWNPLLLLLMFQCLPLLALLGIGLWASRALPSRPRMALHLALFPLVPAFVLCLRHTRYTSLLAAALWGMAAAVAFALPHAGRSSLRRITAALLAIGCVGSLALALTPLRNPQLPFMPVDRWVPQMLQRDIARELSTLPDFAGSRVLCDYNLAPFLQMFARSPTTGGLYWENLDGLQAAAAILAAPPEPEALRRIRERGIQWIVFESKPGSDRNWLYLQYGSAPQLRPADTLAHRLAAPGLAPRWLEPVPAEDTPLAAQAGYRIFRVR